MVQKRFRDLEPNTQSLHTGCKGAAEVVVAPPGNVTLLVSLQTEFLYAFTKVPLRFRQARDWRFAGGREPDPADRPVWPAGDCIQLLNYRLGQGHIGGPSVLRAYRRNPHESLSTIELRPVGVRKLLHSLPGENQEPDQRPKRPAQSTRRLEREPELPIGKHPISTSRDWRRLHALERIALQVALAHRPTKHATQDRVDFPPGRSFAAQPIEHRLQIGSCKLRQCLVSQHRDGVMPKRPLGVLPRPFPPFFEAKLDETIDVGLESKILRLPRLLTLEVVDVDPLPNLEKKPLGLGSGGRRCPRRTMLADRQPARLRPATADPILDQIRLRAGSSCLDAKAM